MYQFLVLVLFLGLHLTHSAVIRDDSKINAVIRSFFQKKCASNADENAFIELERAVEQFPSCTMEYSFNPRTEEEYFSYMCKQPKIYGCFEHLLTKAEPCFDPKEKYFSDFLLSTYNASIYQLCKDGQEVFVDMLQNLQTAAKRCNNIRPNMIAKKCFGEAFPSEDTSESDFVLTKSILCNALGTAGQCLVDGFKRKCEDDTFPNFISEGLQPYFGWCAENNKNTV